MRFDSHLGHNIFSMKKKDFAEIPLLSFGNDITVRGVVMHNVNSDSDLLIYLPNEKASDLESFIEMGTEQWFELTQQLDTLQIETLPGVIVSKGRRQLDQKICWEVYRRDKFKCRYCGINNVPLTVDHIITWETGGATHVDNLLTCCRKCNRKRGNLDYGSWLQHKFYLEKSSKYLSEKERSENEKIIHNLSSLPRVNKIRTR